MAKRSPSRDNPRAEHAFADYVGLGSSRSIGALHKRYLSVSEPCPTKRLPTLKEWSSRYGWQARIADAVSAESDRMLHEASALDADTFLATSRLLNEQVRLATPMMADLVVKVRESVRKPLPKGGASVDVNVHVNVAVQEYIDQVALEDGLTEEEKAELLANVQRHLATTRA